VEWATVPKVALWRARGGDFGAFGELLRTNYASYRVLDDMRTRALKKARVTA
jgi:hypothetical protein